MDEKVSAQTLVSIAFIVIACAIIAVTNQVEAEEQSRESQAILAHPDDKVGIPLEEKRLDEAEKQARSNGNILTAKEKKPEELVLGPVYNEKWPKEPSLPSTTNQSQRK